MLPILQSQIDLSYFDQVVTPSRCSQKRYLVASEHRNFVVSESTFYLLKALLEGSADTKLPVDIYNELAGANIDSNDFERLAWQHIPAALLAGTDAQPPKTPFSISVTLLSTRALQPITHFTKHLFNPGIMTTILSIFALIHLTILPVVTTQVHDTWSLVNGPIFIFLMVVSYFIHEIGHVSACRYFGATHGNIGVGLYFIFPAFYADVSKAWALSSNKRVIVDLGGLYFQSIMLIIVDSLAYVQGSALAYLLSWTITLTMLHTLNPFFKFDGYWLLSDLTGIVNLHAKMRSTIQALLKAIFTFKKPVFLAQRFVSLLIVYSFFALLFMGYIGHFIFLQISHLAVTMPNELSLWWGTAVNSPLSFSSVFLTVFQCLSILFWPVMLVLLTFVYLRKFLMMIGGKRKNVAHA